jgi:tetratricopeptide (TPR) repeat protein
VKLESRFSKTPNDAPVLSSLAIALAGSGQTDRAITMANRAAQLAPVSADALDGPFHVRTLAMVYTMVGRPDQAIETLDYLLSVPSNISVKALSVMPEFAPLRGHPRFQELLKKYEQDHGA